jgi:carbon monoxide dehydrogenase subunit G
VGTAVLAYYFNYEERRMRIEGTYTFSAPIARVFAILTDPDTLQGAIPGCERLIQFGPPDAEGAVTLEARMRFGPGQRVRTLQMTLGAVRRPEHVRLDVRDAREAVHAVGRIDLVEQEQHTIGAYVWEIESEGAMRDQIPAISAEDGRGFAQAVCQRIAEQLRAEQVSSNGRHVLEGTVAQTAQGHIVILPRTSAALLPERPVLRRVVWMTAGLAAGLTAIGLAIQLVRRLDVGNRD